VFRGSFEHTIDEKGRVSIPSTFRKILLGLQDDRLILTKFILDSYRCLDVYPQVEWERFEEELKKKPRFDEKFLKLEHFYVSNAQECLVDRHGRILLPQVLRDYADLRKDVVFTSALEKFRIWDKDTWQKYNEESQKDLVQNPHLFNSLNVNVQ
jgi:MraZ protein